MKCILLKITGRWSELIILLYIYYLNNTFHITLLYLYEIRSKSISRFVNIETPSFQIVHAKYFFSRCNSSIKLYVIMKTRNIHSKYYDYLLSSVDSSLIRSIIIFIFVSSEINNVRLCTWIIIPLADCFCSIGSQYTANYIIYLYSIGQKWWVYFFILPTCLLEYYTIYSIPSYV